METADINSGETAYLVERCNDGFGDTFVLSKENCTLGRSFTNSVILKEISCSREHAVVDFAGGRWRVRDLRSLNGSSLNGVALDEKAMEMSPGDDIQLGHAHFIFVDNMAQLPVILEQPQGLQGNSFDVSPPNEEQPLPSGVESLRDEFRHWLGGRHGSVLRRPANHSTGLLSGIARNCVNIPETQWCGAMAKCCYYVEAIVAACLKMLLPLAGDHGIVMLEKIGIGKPLDRFTLGQYVQMLDALDADISREFLKHQRDHLPASCETRRFRLLGPRGLSQLYKLVRMRNDFAHGRWQQTHAEKEIFAKELPEAVFSLCESFLVFAAVILESIPYPGNSTTAQARPITVKEVYEVP